MKDLQALREELRLQTHLFKAEAKSRWEILEGRWREVAAAVEKLEKQSTETAKSVILATRKALTDLRVEYRRLLNI